MKKEKKWARQPMILSAMRRIWIKSPMYKAVKDAAKVSYTAKNKDGTDSKAHRVKFRCAKCKELYVDKKVQVIDSKGKLKKKKVPQLHVDHIDPVINPETGMRSIEEWIERQFIGIAFWDPKINNIRDLEGKIQILCLKCHNEKSNMENSIRREVKKNKAS